MPGFPRRMLDLITGRVMAGQIRLSTPLRRLPSQQALPSRLSHLAHPLLILDPLSPYFLPSLKMPNDLRNGPDPSEIHHRTILLPPPPERYHRSTILSHRLWIA